MTQSISIILNFEKSSIFFLIGQTLQLKQGAAGVMSALVPLGLASQPLQWIGSRENVQET